MIKSSGMTKQKLPHYIYHKQHFFEISSSVMSFPEVPRYLSDLPYRHALISLSASYSSISPYK